MALTGSGLLELDGPGGCTRTPSHPKLEPRTTMFAALFIHTQVPSVLAARWMKRIPTVVSVDATPIQYDQLGAQYMHQRRGPHGGRHQMAAQPQHVRQCSTHRQLVGMVQAEPCR